MHLWLLLVAVVGSGLATLTPNPGPTVAAIVSLAAVFALLARVTETAPLLFICGMQWLQGSLKVFHADVLGVPLWTMTGAHHIEEAVYLTLLWVVLLAAGARLALTRHAVVPPALMPERSEPHLRAFLLLYVGWTVFSTATSLIAVGGARQIVLALNHMRWAVVFAVFLATIKSKRGLWVAWLVLAFEVLTGLASFFSNFKTPLFLFVLAVVTAGYRLSFRQVVAAGVLGAAIVYLGAIWSAIKMDYRERLNEGTGVQAVTIDTEERIEEMADLLSTIDDRTVASGFERLVERLAYVDFFAHTIDYVPTIHPHEGGRIWGGALVHVLVPRLLFPDKPSLPSDTSIAERYTGLNLHNDQLQTSISLGLPAITYVDFGRTWMFAIPGLLGLLYGGMYRYFRARAPWNPLAHGFAVAVVVQQTSVGPSAHKVLGGQILTFLVAALLWHVLTPLLSPWTRIDVPLGAGRRG